MRDASSPPADEPVCGTSGDGAGGLSWQRLAHLGRRCRPPPGRVDGNRDVADRTRIRRALDHHAGRGCRDPLRPGIVGAAFRTPLHRDACEVRERRAIRARGRVHPAHRVRHGRSGVGRVAAAPEGERCSRKERRRNRADARAETGWGPCHTSPDAVRDTEALAPLYQPAAATPTVGSRLSGDPMPSRPGPIHRVTPDPIGTGASADAPRRQRRVGIASGQAVCGSARARAQSGRARPHAARRPTPVNTDDSRPGHRHANTSRSIDLAVISWSR
jgi:hypothetical protein